MFAASYFAASYFAPSYWPGAGVAVGVVVVEGRVLVASVGASVLRVALEEFAAARNYEAFALAQAVERAQGALPVEGAGPVEGAREVQ